VAGHFAMASGARISRLGRTRLVAPFCAADYFCTPDPADDCRPRNCLGYLGSIAGARLWPLGANLGGVDPGLDLESGHYADCGNAAGRDPLFRHSAQPAALVVLLLARVHSYPAGDLLSAADRHRSPVLHLQAAGNRSARLALG